VSRYKHGTYRLQNKEACHFDFAIIEMKTKKMYMCTKFSISQLVNFSANFWNVQEFRNTVELRQF